MNTVSNADQFVMWLHGYLEIENPQWIDEFQTKLIKEKLEGLFVKVTPDRTPQKRDSKEWDFFDKDDESSYIRPIREAAKPMAYC